MASAMIVAAACGAGDNRVDPGDLELRDLLGVAPDVASSWDAEQRAAARRVLATGFRAHAASARLAIDPGATVDERVANTLAVLDRRRRSGGDGALGVVRVAVAATELTATARAAQHAAITASEGGATAPAVELWLGEQWDRRAWGHLPGRGLEVLSALAIDAGHERGPVVVVPAPRLTVIAGYVESLEREVPPRLVVNPILLAALEPAPGEPVTMTGRAGRGGRPGAARGWRADRAAR